MIQNGLNTSQTGNIEMEMKVLRYSAIIRTHPMAQLYRLQLVHVSSEVDGN